MQNYLQSAYHQLDSMNLDFIDSKHQRIINGAKEFILQSKTEVEALHIVAMVQAEIIKYLLNLVVAPPPPPPKGGERILRISPQKYVIN